MRVSILTITGLGLAIATTGPALAADIAVVPKKLIVVDKLAAASKAKTVFVAKDVAVIKGSGTDPNQISVQFDVVYGDGSAAGAFTLPAGASVSKSPGWVVNKDSVAKYVNKEAPEGPTHTKVAVIKPGKLLKLVGRGLGDTPLDVFGAGDPGAGGVQTAYCVTNGAQEFCHCSAFSGCVYKTIAAGTGAKLVCKAGTGDTLCGGGEPSTTSTTTTSTTTSTTLGDIPCVDTTDCPLGTVCSDMSSCTSDACTMDADCPPDHLCPVAGPDGAQRHCAAPCAVNADCRATEACKRFAEGRGCGVSGSGQNGESCTDFSDCSGQRACHVWPGGYCARLACTGDGDCESDTFCATVQAQNICVRRCGGGEPECRIVEGYVCTELDVIGGGGDAGCVPGG